MKTIKCSQVGGGDCDFSVTADTQENCAEQFSAHAKVVHAEMMEKATPESMQKWNEDLTKLWEETPDNE